MMPHKKLSPHPILCEMDDDYVQGSFHAKVKQKATSQKLYLYVDYALDQEGLQKLIRMEKACYLTHVECSLLCTREIIKTVASHAEKELDIGNFDNVVEINNFIVATEDITGYYDQNINQKRFGKNGSFTILKGGILAIGRRYTINVNHEGQNFDKLADIIVLFADANNQGIAWTSLESDSIVIHVSQEMLDLYRRYKKEKKYDMIALLILPSLVTVLTQISQGEEGAYEGYRWYDVLQRKLMEKNIKCTDLNLEAGDDKKSVFLAAQDMLKYPLAAALAECAKEGERV